MLKTIGIIGGMGPLAAADLFAKITRLTAAETDQAHIHVIVDSNTAIPDRTAAILSGGASPVPELVRSALRLESAGADVLVMSCNTAHYFIEEVRTFTRLPFIHMIEETAKEARRRGCGCAGLLATEGTCRTGLYDRAFAVQGVKLVKPEEALEAHIMDMIYQGVKAGVKEYPLAGVREAMDALRAQGASAFVLGCTEMPLAFSMYKIEGAVIDPTEVLARRAIEFVGGRTVQSE